MTLAKEGFSVSGLDMPLATAKEIIKSGFAFAGKSALAPMAIVVLDSGGHVVAAERQDGASLARLTVAHAKAHGAVSFGMGSRSLMARAEAQPYFIAAAGSLPGISMVPVPGGVLVRSGERIVGAVGISGDSSDNDEAAALAAITACGLEGLPD